MEGGHGFEDESQVQLRSRDRLGPDAYLSCRLLVTHDQLREGANGELYGGWMMILSGLKTLLEAGELLTTPGSLRYSQATDWAS